MRRIINAANRMPRLGKKGAKPVGGLVSALEGLSEEFQIAWVGWPGENQDPANAPAPAAKNAKNSIQPHPVHLSQEELDGYYHGFANASLWPLLHYMQNYARFDDRWLEQYREVNRKFCRKILEIAGKDDLVWIHDYHLMLLPAMLREERPELKIGFFLHTPFPSNELFRCHPAKKELLEGLLGADLIGFHTFGYLRHFRSSILHLLGVESEIDRVEYGSGTSSIGVFPIGINWQSFQHTLEGSQCQQHLEGYRTLFRRKRLVLSVERMDYTKGIPHKLHAIAHFLQQNPELANSTVFMIIAVPSREEVDAYHHLKQEVDALVGEINGRHSTIENVPIHLINSSIEFTELCALYALADAAMVTPLMDGMNLVAKEYIACQDTNMGRKGVLILSEFAGAAQELFNAVMVNPHHPEEVARAIKAALDMSDQDKDARSQPMRERVIKHDVIHWARQFVEELAQTKPADARGKALPQSAAQQLRSADAPVGLFLDYDGTLRELTPDPLQATLTDELRRVMEHLAASERYKVHIVSGRRMEFLQEQFAEFPFTLVSEHGYAWAEGGAKPQLLNQSINTAWKEDVMEILQLYASSTPGSFVEDKNCAVVWHYRNSYPEFGKWKAGELLGELTEVISNLPVEIHHGKMIVEVHSQQVSKGIAVQAMTQRHSIKTSLCAGDDQTDETMFRAAVPGMTSVKIGTGRSAAQYRLPSPAALRELLLSL